PMTSDIGLLASPDPVAIDQASYDLVIKQCKDFEKQNGDAQLETGAKIGLGTRDYELINA
ncbi:MAG: 4Fe-4S ferredoxin, partial [Patescibacteria group bacterium]|nr:4Fe-4S ferredoxin [Patescibacteria group bacterium]